MVGKSEECKRRERTPMQLCCRPAMAARWPVAARREAPGQWTTGEQGPSDRPRERVSWVWEGKRRQVREKGELGKKKEKKKCAGGYAESCFSQCERWTRIVWAGGCACGGWNKFFSVLRLC